MSSIHSLLSVRRLAFMIWVDLMESLANLKCQKMRFPTITDSASRPSPRKPAFPASWSTLLISQIIQACFPMANLNMQIHWLVDRQTSRTYTGIYLSIYLSVIYRSIAYQSIKQLIYHLFVCHLSILLVLFPWKTLTDGVSVKRESSQGNLLFPQQLSFKLAVA